jgi:hypothetical protein
MNAKKALAAKRLENEQRAATIAGQISADQRRNILSVYADGQGCGGFDWDEQHPEGTGEEDRDSASHRLGVEWARRYMLENYIADEEPAVVDWLISLLG